MLLLIKIDSMIFINTRTDARNFNFTFAYLSIF